MQLVAYKRVGELQKKWKKINAAREETATSFLIMNKTFQRELKIRAKTT